MAPSRTDTGLIDSTISTASAKAKAVKDTLANPSVDFGSYRQLVPLAARADVTYINASFNPPSNQVVHEAITRYADEALNHVHPKPSWQATAVEVRALVARYVNAGAPEDIALTRDTTEGLNCFIRSVKFQPGDNVVILDTEHPNHAYGWLAMRAYGLEVRQVPTITAAEKNGVTAATAETFAPFVDERTIAIGLSSIMFHSGQWNDVAGICSTFRPKGVHVVVDMTQHVGFADVNVRDLGVSAAAFGMHKGLNCPTGLAALYVDPKVVQELDPTPPIVGFGAVQNIRGDLLAPSDDIIYHPNARRYEHLNVSLVATVAAKAYLEFYLDTLTPKEVKKHLFYLGDALRAHCDRLGIEIVGPKSHTEHAPHLYILDLHDTRWHDLLKENNVFVTPYRLGIRFSFGFYNNLDDVEEAARVLELGIKAGLPRGRQ